MITSLAAFALAILSRGNCRLVALCTFIGTVMAAYALLDPIDWGISWFALCAMGELLIVGAAWSLNTRASVYVATIGLVATATHLITMMESVFLDARLLWMVYPYVIMLAEWVQLAVILAFTPPGLAATRTIFISTKKVAEWIGYHRQTAKVSGHS